jgi:hypothetical protein
MNHFFSPDSGSVARSYMPRTATMEEPVRSAGDPCLQLDTNYMATLKMQRLQWRLAAATMTTQQISDLHIEEV